MSNLNLPCQSRAEPFSLTTLVLSCLNFFVRQTHGCIRPSGRYAVMFDNTTVVTPFAICGISPGTPLPIVVPTGLSPFPWQDTGAESCIRRWVSRANHESPSATPLCTWYMFR